MTTPFPPEEVREVRFRIDRELTWIDDEPPYEFGGDGAYLVTTWLGAGQHHFAARAVATDGATADSRVTARVRSFLSPEGPGGLHARPVQGGDVKASGLDVDPSFSWALDIYSGFLRIGWKEAHTGILRGHAYETRSTRRLLHIYAPIQMGPEGVGRISGGYRVSGYHCRPDGPFATYRLAPTRGRLRLQDLGITANASFKLVAVMEPCAPRRAILEGAWYQWD